MNKLDKEEFRIKLEEINHLVEKQDYKGAMDVVDSIDWRRVKNVRTLCVVGEIYAANKRYDDSKEIFLLAYHKASVGKNILYRLIEMSLKMNNIEEAVEFYDEFVSVAPRDNIRYVLKYKILKAQNAPVEEQIRILEEYKEKEFTERWSYELASLYYESGNKEKCLEICDEMILWFNDGRYVIKALELKMRLGVLSGTEKEKYNDQLASNGFARKELDAIIERAEHTEEEEDPESVSEKSPVIETIRMNERDLNNAESIQEKISKGIRDIFGGVRKDSEDDEELNDTEEKEVSTESEMLRDIRSAENYEYVPELEPEPVQTEAAKEPKEEIPITYPTTITMPELKIPESMRNFTIQEAKPFVVPEIPKAPEIGRIKETVLEKAEQIVEKSQEKVENLTDTAEADPEEDFTFNLEDTILAAATAQGIQIPEELPEETEKLLEEVSEEMEEALKELPEEIEEALEELPEEIEELLEELPEETEELPEELPEEVEEVPEQAIEVRERVCESPSCEQPKQSVLEDVKDLEKEELPSFEEEPTEEDMRLAEEEFLNGPLDKTDSPKTEKSTVNRKPEGMNTEVFNFQQELKKALGENFCTDFGDPEAEDTETPAEMSQEEELEAFIDDLQPKYAPVDIIPREKVLTEEEKKLFTYFVKVPGMKEQLVETLCDIQKAASEKTSKTGNVIVMGSRDSGKTRLISGLIPAVCRELHLEAAKVAYVFADQLNGRDIASIVQKLSGGFLVIENVNQLSQESAEQLDKAMEFRTDGLKVIIEDEKIGMRKFIARYPKLARKFTSMINIPVFTNDELVNFARIYTKENGYVIDQMGMLALYNAIGLNQKEDEPMTVGSVKAMIDAAIAKRQGGFMKLKKRKTDPEGFVILQEKDFS